MDTNISTKTKVLLAVLSIPIMIWTIIPIIWILAMSLKGSAALSDPSRNVFGNFWPKEISFENYKLIFQGGASELFLPALRNSLVVCLSSTLISVVLAMFCAYAISRLEFPGKRIILGTALAVSFFPVISMVTPLYELWRNIGLFDTIPGLILPYLALTLPLSIWTMTAFFQQIPWEMEQAAQVDGATEWQIFWRVVLPLMKPGLISTAILNGVWMWNEFFIPLIVAFKPESQTMPVGIVAFIGSYSTEWGLVFASVVIATAPVIFAYLLITRQFQSGLTAGAIKG